MTFVALHAPGRGHCALFLQLHDDNSVFSVFPILYNFQLQFFNYSSQTYCQLMPILVKRSHSQSTRRFQELAGVLSYSTVIILAFSWVQRVLKNVDIRTHKSPHHQHIRGGRAASILCLLTGQHTEKLLNMPPLLSIDNPHQTNCIKTNLVILFMVWPHHNVSFLINFHFSSTYKRESFNSWLVVFTKLVLN